MKNAIALALAGGVLGMASQAQAAGTALAPEPQAAGPALTAPSAEPLLVDGDWSMSGWLWSAGDDHSDDDSSDDDCDPQRNPACKAGNAAPAGTVAPPRNGLFTDGTAPTVKSN